MPFQIFETQAQSTLSPVSGFLREAGYTHSLNPSRNCTFGCSYCYVPTMRVQGGLQPQDWQHWGEWTTFKTNAAALLQRELKAGQVIYCSPLTDPYQPAEEQQQLMPAVLEAVAQSPPRAFVIQTRGPLILRDIDLLKRIPRLRVSFSITTDRDEVRRVFESRCAPIECRLQTVDRLTRAGVPTSVAIAPMLPCDPTRMANLACDVSSGPLVMDPFHVRESKRLGASTRSAARAICQHYGWQDWLTPSFQNRMIELMRVTAEKRQRPFGKGPEGFGMLACSIF